MTKRYNFSRSFNGPTGPEIYAVEGTDSFDEARKIVDRAIYERGLEVPTPTPRSPFGSQPIVPIAPEVDSEA